MDKDDKFDGNFNNDGNMSFEDISSNSAKYQIDTGKIDLFFDDPKHSYRRKKRGIFKFFDNIRYGIYKWWKCMKKSKKGILIVFVSFVLALTIFIMAGGLNYLYHYNDIKVEHVRGQIDGDVMNIALFGIDSRDTDGKSSFNGNSDSIMILSLNFKTKKIKIISLLRDTFVPLGWKGEKGYGKINAAYAKGGPTLAVQTIDSIFNLDITEYATVNFYGMADIIDAVGGIDVELTKNEVTARGVNNHGINDMIDEICQKEGLKFSDYKVSKWGKQHLNGVQAVAYSRIRYCTNVWGTSNDYGRSDRQRFVMKQLFNSVKDLPKSRYLSLVKALVPCTETSLEFNKIVDIGWNMMMQKPAFEEYRLPMTEADADKEKGEKGSDYNFLITPTPSGYGSILYMDLNYVSKVIHAVLYSDMTVKDYIAKNPVQKNSWYKGSYGGGSSSGSSGKTSSTESTTKEPTKPTETETDDPDKKTESESPGGTDTGTETGNESGEDKPSEEQKPPEGGEVEGGETPPESQGEEGT
ncbi:MAG: LCP family protein [Clostridia bacterium]|nr:LCP family protein [Clostridia bacterium]